MRVRLLPVIVTLTGCLDAFAPDVGPPNTPAPEAGVTCPPDSDPTRTVSYASDIDDGVFQRGNCLGCHTGDGLGIRQSGLDLESYATLRTGGGRTGANVVIPGDPCASLIVQKIEPGPPFGRRMPYNGPPYLSTADIQLVRDWIAEGARDN